MGKKKPLKSVAVHHLVRILKKVLLLKPLQHEEVMVPILVSMVQQGREQD